MAFGGMAIGGMMFGEMVFGQLTGKIKHNQKKT
jgi:hypothetical protein